MISEAPPSIYPFLLKAVLGKNSLNFGDPTFSYKNHWQNHLGQNN